MKTANPLLISITETAFQLSVTPEEVAALVRSGELPAKLMFGRLLIPYDAVVQLARKARRNPAILIEAQLRADAEGAE